MIGNKKFTINDKIENISYDRFLYYLEEEIMVLVVLTGLYEQNIITLDKLKGQLSSLRKGDLLKHKRTYHCDINNKWYSHEPAKEVFKDLSKDITSVNYIKLLEVLQLYTTKNYNYCINLIINSIIKPTLNRFSQSSYSYDYFSQLFSTNLTDFPKIKIEGYRSECYECGSSHFVADERATRNKINTIVEFFHLYKKGNLTKIPKY